MFNPGDGIIFLGDPTSHGGKVITGQQNYIVDGRPVACVGDKVTCPKDGHNGVTTIVEGHPTLRVNGKQVATHGCHTACGAALISMSRGYHMLGDERADAKEREMQKQGVIPYKKPISHRSPESEGEDDTKLRPGFHIVRKAAYRDQLKRELLPSPSPDVDSMFDRLNANLPEYVLPGSMVVLSDPDNEMCMAEEQQLQDQARQIQTAVQQLEPSQADIMMTNWEAVLELSNSLGQSSTAMGITASSLDPLKTATAESIDALADAWERGERYVINQGDRIMARVKPYAQAFMDRGFELSETAQALKTKIGVASDKVLHKGAQAWDGLKKLNLPSVADGIREASSVAKTLDAATWLGIAIDTTATRLSVESSCTAYSTTKSCRKAQLVQYGGLAGRTFGSFGGAGVGRATSGVVCLGVGNLGGKLVCSIVLTGTGAFGGSETGNSIGRSAGEAIFEIVYGGEDSEGSQ